MEKFHPGDMEHSLQKRRRVIHNLFSIHFGSHHVVAIQSSHSTSIAYVLCIMYIGYERSVFHHSRMFIYLFEIKLFHWL